MIDQIFDLPRGYIPSPRSATDYIKGVNSPLVSGLLNIDLRPFRPLYAPQKINGFDSMGCVSWAGVQENEIWLNYFYQNNMLSPEFKKFLEDNGYVVSGKIYCSKMFIAILSGTSPNGNTFSNVANAIRHYGLIPEHMLPFNPATGATWNDVYTKNYPKPEALAMGQKFLEFVDIGYHYPQGSDFLTEIKDGPVQVAFATDGGYWRNPAELLDKTLPENHSVLLDWIEPDNKKEMVDHYEFLPTFPFYRLLNSDYPIPSSMQFVVTLKGQSMANAILFGTNKQPDGTFKEFGFAIEGISPDGLKQLAFQAGFTLPMLADGQSIDFQALQLKASELIKK